jgi:CheY-like chemotaxis protein
MVKGVAEQSGGRFVLTSRRGEGTTAEIWLPTAAAGSTDEDKVAQHASSPGRTTRRALSVLVVDDDTLVLENTAAMLDDLGHSVIEARSGSEALDIVRRAKSLDLVVTDHAMPGMNGMELARHIAEQRPDLPVLLASGYAEIGSGSEVDLPRLSKPFSQEALERAIDGVVCGPVASGTVVRFRPKSG